MAQTVTLPESEFEEMKQGLEQLRETIAAWEATLETLQDDDVREQLRQSRQEIEDGNTRSWDEIKDEL